MSQTLLEELKAVADKRIDPLLERRTALEEELKDLNKEIATAQRAISVLEGKDSAPAAPKIAEKKSRKNNKPSASVEKVLEVLTAELKRGGGKLSKVDLVASAKEKLREAGFGLTGVKQRAEKILKESDQFACKGNSVSLSAKMA